MMMAGVQPGPCKSNVISRICGGKRFHVRRKPERWSTLNRSSTAVEGAWYVGWAKEASDSSHGGIVLSRRWRMKGSRHCGEGRGWSASMEGAVTGPGTVKCCARSAQGSGVGARVSDRIASRGARSNGLGEVPSKVPGSKSATPANGITCRPFSTIYSSVEKMSAACSISTR